MVDAGGAGPKIGRDGFRYGGRTRSRRQPGRRNRAVGTIAPPGVTRDTASRPLRIFSRSGVGSDGKGDPGRASCRRCNAGTLCRTARDSVAADGARRSVVVDRRRDASGGRGDRGPTAAGGRTLDEATENACRRQGWKCTWSTTLWPGLTRTSP